MEVLNKTFLKFLLGFLSLIALSFALLFAAGYYRERSLHVQGEAEVPAARSHALEEE